MHTAWRIAKPWTSPFSGWGSQRFGGRWNSPGIRVAYTSGSVALATLELLVHLERGSALPEYALVSCEFDDSLVIEVDVTNLPANWHAHPSPSELKAVGDTWIREARSAVLRVPSAIVHTEFNYVLNPAHHDFRSVVIHPPRPYRIDLRLVK